MNISFGFLNGRDVYTATVPTEIKPGFDAYSTLAFSTAVESKSAVQFRTTGDFDATHVDETLRSTVTSAQGSSVKIYDYGSDPATQLAYWTLPVGSLWSAFDAAPDGATAQSELMAGLRVYQDSMGLPRITIASPLAAGDPAQLTERDSVTLYAKDDALTPNSVTFARSAQGDNDATVVEDGDAIVTVLSAEGITVTVDGPSGNASALGQVAATVAASIKKTSGVSAGALNMWLNGGISYLPLLLSDGMDDKEGTLTISGGGTYAAAGGSAIAAEGPFTATGSAHYRARRIIDPVHIDGTMTGTSADGRWRFEARFGATIYPVVDVSTAWLTVDGTGGSTLVSVQQASSGLHIQGPFDLPPDAARLV